MELTIEQKCLAIETLAKTATMTDQYGNTLEINKPSIKKIAEIIESIDISDLSKAYAVILTTKKEEPTQTKEPAFKIETKEELEKILNEAYFDFSKQYPCDAMDYIFKKFVESKFTEPKQEPKLLNELKGKNCELQPKDLETILNEFVISYQLSPTEKDIKHYASRVMYMFPELNNQRELLEKFVDGYQKSDESLKPYLEQFIKYNYL